MGNGAAHMLILPVFDKMEFAGRVRAPKHLASLEKYYECNRCFPNASPLADETLIDAIVDVLCGKMLDDYHVNCFSCSG